MHSSGSILRTFCEKVRQYLDDPDLDSKYDNDYLVRYPLKSAMVDVQTRISMMGEHPILHKLDITLEDGVEYYTLPPSIRSVWRFVAVDSDGTITNDFRPRNEFHWSGPGWKLDGNQIWIDANRRPATGNIIQVWYVPSGEAECHLSSTGEIAAGELILTLGATQDLGQIDMRPNGLLGQYLRLIDNDANSNHDERIISAHVAGPGGTGTVTMRTASVGQVVDAATVVYEIVPFLMDPMLEAIACRAAMKMGVGRRISKAHTGALLLEYRSAIKTAYDQTSSIMGRHGQLFERHTVDNQDSFQGVGNMGYW